MSGLLRYTTQIAINGQGWQISQCPWTGIKHRSASIYYPEPRGFDYFRYHWKKEVCKIDDKLVTILDIFLRLAKSSQLHWMAYKFIQCVREWFEDKSMRTKIEYGFFAISNFNFSNFKTENKSNKNKKRR